MRKLAIAAAFSQLFALTCCSEIKPEEVTHNALESAPLGTNIQLALKNLTGVGFTCRTEGGNEYNLECTREGGSGNLLAGCVQRISLELSPAKRVAGYHDSRVACAGL